MFKSQWRLSLLLNCNSLHHFFYFRHFFVHYLWWPEIVIDLISFCCMRWGHSSSLESVGARIMYSSVIIYYYILDVFILYLFLFILLGPFVNYYIYVNDHKLIKRKKKGFWVNFFSSEIPNLVCLSLSHTHTHTHILCGVGKSCYEIPPEPKNRKTRGISCFCVCCWVLCQVEAHRSLSPERVFPSDSPPPPCTHPLSHTYTL